MHCRQICYYSYLAGEYIMGRSLAKRVQKRYFFGLFCFHFLDLFFLVCDETVNNSEYFLLSIPASNVFSQTFTLSILKLSIFIAKLKKLANFSKFLNIFILFRYE